MEPEQRPSTADAVYTERLRTLRSRKWKRLLNVQLPYRLHLARLRLGFTLDVGCGIGRNLDNLKGNAVGVDHNPHSVAIATSKGLRAFVPNEFLASEYAREGRFESLMCAHVLEHLAGDEAMSLLRQYLPFLKRGGRAVLMTPQEAGFRSDPTHVEFRDFDSLRVLAREAGLTPVRAYSRPFPRIVGRVFKYNEFVLITRRV